jgi:hypothetical protein
VKNLGDLPFSILAVFGAVAVESHFFGALLKREIHRKSGRTEGILVVT